MKKEIAGLCMSLVLGGTYVLNPLEMLPIHAITTASFITPAVTYSMGTMTAINDGVGAFVGDAAMMQQFSRADDFTMNTKVKLTGTSAVQALFFIGDSKKDDNYVIIYITPNQTIGIEARNAGTRPLNQKKDTGINFKDGAVHNVTFTQKKGEYFRFYVDGQKVLEGAAPSSFCNGLIGDTDFMGIGTGKRLSYGNYALTGEMGSVQLFDNAIAEEQILAYHQGITEEQDVLYEGNGGYFKEDSEYASDQTVDVAAFTKRDSGAISVRYRASSVSSKDMALFSISDSTQENKSLAFVVNPGENKLGIKLSNGVLAGTNEYLLSETHGVHIKDTVWHTISVVKSSETNGDLANRYTFYQDGKKLNFYSGKVGFMNNIDTADSVNIGFIKNVADAGSMKFTGAIDKVKVYNTVLSEAEALAEHTIAYVPTQITDMTNAVKTETESLFYSGYKNSSAYRIPSLIKTMNGTMLAAIDKRNTGSGDAGNIDSVVRRKEAGSKNFQEPITMIDLIDKNNSTPSAFLIDPAMVQDKETGRIFMLVDMFPESSGLMNTSILTTGSGYKKIDGVDYQKLFAADNTEYTIREKGIVYDNTNQKTEYQIITECKAPYKELGNIYKKGVYVGNMYIFSGVDKGELHIARTQYLWLTHSDDDGKTWSLPKDITPQVKQDWMMFLGTGPGVGIQLADGSLTFPVYSASSNVGGSQASALIRSTDGGETWSLGDSPVSLGGFDRETMNSGNNILTESSVVQLNNGDIKLFMRNQSGKVKVATSTDAGRTWDKIESIPTINDVYCQLSTTHYVKDGKEFVALLNPAGSGGRNNGTFYIGEVNGSNITWNHSKLLASGNFSYSSIAALGVDSHGDEMFAAFYEGINGNLDYTEFDENYIKASMINSTLKAPEMLHKEIVVDGNDAMISLTYDQIMMAAGKPALTLQMGDKTWKAAYQSGSGSKTIQFKITLSEDMTGLIRAVGMDESNGLLENIQNEKADIDFVALDLTEVKFVGVTATSQHSSSTAENTDGAAVNVMDDNKNTYWHSTYGDASITLPQSLTLDLGDVQNIYKFGYLPRQNSQSGHVLDFDILVSNTQDGPYTKVYSGMFKDTYDEQFAEFAPIDARYIRFTINSSTAGTSTSVAGVRAFTYTEGVFEDADKTELATKIMMAENLLQREDDFTSSSIGRLQAAVSFAGTIVQGTASANMVNNAIELLDTAVSTLIDLSELKQAITQADALLASNYTADSWTIFQTALDDVKNTYKNITVKRGVSDMLIRLQYVTQQLVAKTSNKQELSDYVEACKNVTAADYTQASYTTFKTSLDLAITMLHEDVTQQEIDRMLGTLQRDREALVSVVELKAAIAAAELIDPSSYTVESYARVALALESAREALKNGSVMSAASAILAIQSGIESLEAVAGQMTTAQLDYIIARSKDVMKKQAYYDTKANSWSQFEAALSEAEQAKVDMTSQTLIDNAAKKLAEAFENIRLIANEETLANLNRMILKLNAIDLSNYASVDQRAFIETKADLQAMVMKASFTMEEYEVMVKKMEMMEKRMELGKLNSSKPTEQLNGINTGDDTNASLFAGSALLAGIMAIVLKKSKKAIK